MILLLKHKLVRFHEFFVLRFTIFYVKIISYGVVFLDIHLDTSPVYPSSGSSAEERVKYPKIYSELRLKSSGELLKQIRVSYLFLPITFIFLRLKMCVINE